MNGEEILDYVVEIDPESTALKADGFDDCIIGTTWRNNELILVYSKEKIIIKLMQDGIDDYAEAEEYFDYNIAGANFGDKTPIYVCTYQWPESEFTKVENFGIDGKIGVIL